MHYLQKIGLKILEKQQHLQLNKAVQNDLFSVADEPTIEVIERIVEVEKDVPVLNLLRALDVDNLSPREALQQIYALKDALEA